MHPARRLWQHVETVHAVTYFAPEVAEALAATGLQGFWRGYFAGRAGPLGPVGPEVVAAAFHGFSPRFVARFVPSAWHQARPEAAMAARDAGVEAALRRLLGEAAEVDARTVELAEQAITGAEVAGRPLFAAHAARPWPGPPLLRLWWACTMLREHRGDGHVAALTAAGVDGCEANQLAVLDRAVPADRQQVARGWDDDEWAAAGQRAAARPAGFRRGIDDRTDELAMGPVHALGDAGLDELCDRLRPMVTTIAASGTIPFPNPVGVPAPPEP